MREHIRPLPVWPFLIILGLCTMAVPVSLAQGGYSVAGANPYVARKDWRGLLAYTQAWTRANPNDPMAWYYMGQTYGYGFNQPEQAVMAFKRALSLREKWPEAWHALGFSCVQARQYKDAIAATRRAISMEPNRLNYWSTLVQAYAAQGDWNGALQVLQEARQHMAQGTSYDWFNLGNSYAALGRSQEAIAAYDQSLRMNPNYGPAWNNRGIAEQMVGNDAEAMSDYKRAAHLGNAISPGNYSQLQQNIAASRRAATTSSSGAHCVPWVSTPNNSNCGYSGHDACPHPLTICR